MSESEQEKKEEEIVLTGEEQKEEEEEEEIVVEEEEIVLQGTAGSPENGVPDILHEDAQAKERLKLERLEREQQQQGETTGKGLRGGRGSSKLGTANSSSSSRTLASSSSVLAVPGAYDSQGSRREVTTASKGLSGNSSRTLTSHSTAPANSNTNNNSRGKIRPLARRGEADTDGGASQVQGHVGAHPVPANAGKLRPVAQPRQTEMLPVPGAESVTGSMSGRGSKLAMKRSIHSSRTIKDKQDKDMSETEDMTDASDIFQGSFKNLWTQHHDHEQQDPANHNTIQPLPEPPRQTTSGRPGAYSGMPGGNLQRANTPRFSLVGLTPEEIGMVENTSNRRFGGLPITTIQGTSRLAVATEVQEDSTPLELPRATSFRGDLDKDKKKEQQSKTMATYAAGGMLLLIAIIAIVVAVVLTTQDSAGNPAETNSTEFIINTTHLEVLFDALPNTTRQNLWNRTSPQAMAWEWLQNHQNITNLPEWRKQQLFSLTTFYHAFEGPTWPERYRENWMNDAVGECSWINTDQDFMYRITQQYMRTNKFNYTPCNQEGQIQTMALMYLKLEEAQPFVPPELALLPSLTVLAFPFNKISVPLGNIIPSYLHQITNLQVLVIPFNDMDGTIPTHINTLTNLEYLVLGDNQISGSLPTQVAQLPRLKQLSINAVPMVGTFPTQLGLMTTLTDLEIFETNSIGGTIPSELGLLTALNEFALPGNQLSGTIPTQLGQLTNVGRHFILSGNQLVGALPSQLGLLTLSTDLDLYDNQLEGSIPTEYGHLTSAKRLLLGMNNDINGPLPSELGLLTRLQHLRLEGTSVSGSIPDELWSLPELKQLDMTNSPLLSGVVPPAICNLNVNASCSVDMISATTKNCYVAFDCTKLLCGCDCPCVARNNTG